MRKFAGPIAILTAILLLAGCVLGGISFWGTSPPEDEPDNGGTDPNDQEPGEPEPGDDDATEPDPDVIPRPKYVRGLYLSGNGAGAPWLRDPVLELVRETGLNALVIDVKRDDGHITYADTRVELARQANANTNFVDMGAFLDILRQEQIYPIARIVVAKDGFVSKIKPEWFLQDKNGGVWKDSGGRAWADMRVQEYWEYLIALAVEAAEMGFREIQFDYVRWPSGGDGNVSALANVPPANMTQEGPYQRSEVIAAFLTYAREQLAPYGVEVSADTFGIMGSVQNEQSIGQHLEVILSTGIDILCPMIYPGHYWEGSYNLARPNRNPYTVVLRSAGDHLARMEAFGSDMVLRPWLQDFNDWYDKEYKYGVEQIHDQLRALEQLGIKEFLFWNPSNVYTWEAYRSWNWD